MPCQRQQEGSCYRDPCCVSHYSIRPNSIEGPGLTLAFQGSMRLLVNMEMEIHSIEHIVGFMLGQYTDLPSSLSLESVCQRCFLTYCTLKFNSNSWPLRVMTTPPHCCETVTCLKKRNALKKSGPFLKSKKRILREKDEALQKLLFAWGWR